MELGVSLAVSRYIYNKIINYNKEKNKNTYVIANNNNNLKNKINIKNGSR